MTTLHRPIDPAAESITAGTLHIGTVSGDIASGFKAFDENDRLIAVYETREAARRAVYRRYRGQEA